MNVLVPLLLASYFINKEVSWLMGGRSKQHDSGILMRTSLAEFHGTEGVSIACRKDKVQGVVSFQTNFFF